MVLSSEVSQRLHNSLSLPICPRERFKTVFLETLLMFCNCRKQVLIRGKYARYYSFIKMKFIKLISQHWSSLPFLHSNKNSNCKFISYTTYRIPEDTTRTMPLGRAVESQLGPQSNLSGRAPGGFKILCEHALKSPGNAPFKTNYSKKIT